MKKFFILFFFLFFLFFGIGIKKEKEIESIKFASWGSQSETKVLKEIISDFEQKSGISVEFIHIPENYFQKIHLLFAANIAPDVIFINNQNIPMYINANLLEDLTPYFKDELQNFYPVALESFKKDNKVYAIPRDISNLVLYVNKDILKEENIAYTEKIESLDELKSITQKLTKDGRFGLNFEESSLYWLYFVAANGGGILSDNGKNILLSKNETVSAINLYSDFINKYKIMPSKSEIGSMTTAQMFINEKLAMYLGGRWMVPKFRETIDFDWDIIEFPSTQENKVYIDASGWAISNKSKNKNSAIDFVKYVSSEEVSQKFAQSGLIIPARFNIAKEYLRNSHNKKPEHEEIFINMLKNAKPTPVNGNYNKINDILNEEAKNIFENNKSTEEAFNNKTIKEIERLL